jgi:putative tricarboxylic transport membrane protein
VLRTRSTVLAAASASALALTLAACGGDAGGSTGGDGGFEPRGDVTMIVPFGAGGGSDRAGRATATMIEAANGDVNVNVENREGGSGAVGYSHFLGQNGDGETLLATETALLALPISGEVEFDFNDFTPIMKLGDDYTLMIVNADSPYETCADVVDAAKKERIVAGISGITGLDNIVFTLTEQETGVAFDRVPFESGGELTAALLGGQIDVASLNPGEIIGQLEAGKVKALCAYSEGATPTTRSWPTSRRPRSRASTSPSPSSAACSPPAASPRRPASSGSRPWRPRSRPTSTRPTSRTTTCRPTRLPVTTSSST